MIPTQSPRTPVAPPVADVREGAVSDRTERTGLAAPPATSPARSTEQTCTRCKRSGAVKVTVNVGDRRWRFCELCLSRADKTTLLAAVTCKHPYSRAHHGDDGTTYACIDCFEPVPAPAECASDQLCTCVLCREAGRASLGAVVPAAVLGLILGGIAAYTGKIHLPITPTPNGFTLLVVLALVAGCWWLRRAETEEELEKWPANAEPLADATWPDLDPDEALPPLLGTEPKRVRS